jgi:uncharacterized membrane protein
MPFTMWIGPAVYLSALFIIAPLIAAIIGYAAWKGIPENWDRSMYWTAFVVTIVASILVMAYAVRMHADVRTGQYIIQILVFAFGAILFGVAGGCMIGIFTYRHGTGPLWRGATSVPADQANSTQDGNDHKAGRV